MVKMQFDLDGVKIPKTVAGVKVPKKLRKKGKQLIAKANSPEGREAIAAGLTVVGTMLAAKAGAKAARAAERAADDAAAKVRAKTPVRPGEPGIDPANELGDAIAAGIGALQKFLNGARRS